MVLLKLHLVVLLKVWEVTSALDGVNIFLERKNEYGKLNAAIDGVAHTPTSVGAIYVGAIVGFFILISVVWTLASIFFL